MRHRKEHSQIVDHHQEVEGQQPQSPTDPGLGCFTTCAALIVFVIIIVVLVALVYPVLEVWFP